MHVSDVAGVVNGQDVRMVQSRNRGGLLLEPTHPVLVGHQPTRQDLEGDLPPQGACPPRGRPRPPSRRRRAARSPIVRKLLTGGARVHAGGLSLFPVSGGSTG